MWRDDSLFVFFHPSLGPKGGGGGWEVARGEDEGGGEGKGFCRAYSARGRDGADQRGGGGERGRTSSIIGSKDLGGEGRVDGLGDDSELSVAGG